MQYTQDAASSTDHAQEDQRFSVFGPPPRVKQAETSSCAPGLRRRVFAAFACCEYCGSADAGSVDRIIPRNRYGWYEAANVTRACHSCNSNKSDKEFIGPVRSLAVMEARIA